MYGKEDLKEVSVQYEANWRKLIAAQKRGDDEFHTRYVKIEKQLNKKQIAIQKALGCYVPDPCPVASAKLCIDCSGLFQQFPAGNKRTVYREVKANGIPCEYKKVVGFDALLGGEDVR